MNLEGHLRMLALICAVAALPAARAQPNGQAECRSGIASAPTLNAVGLFASAGSCFRDELQLEGSYLLIIGQLRAQSDLGFLTPSGEDDEEKAAELYGYMYFRAGGAGRDEIYRNTKLTDQLYSLIRAWKPELTDDYDPSWAYRRRPDEKKYFESLNYAREARLIQLSRYAQLLRDDTYYGAHVEHQEILRRSKGAMQAGTPDYERSNQLNAIMQSVSERYPEPEYPKAPTYEFTPDPEADFRQIHAGFNGQDRSDTTIAWTREDVERSWIAQVVTEAELASLLRQVDFAHEMMLIHSIGMRNNLTGTLHVVDVDVGRRDSSVSVSVRIGVNEADCEWPDAEAYPFVVVVARKTAERAHTAGYYHGNFGDGCKPAVRGMPAPAQSESNP